MGEAQLGMIENARTLSVSSALRSGSVHKGEHTTGSYARIHTHTRIEAHTGDTDNWNKLIRTLKTVVTEVNCLYLLTD